MGSINVRGISLVPPAPTEYSFTPNGTTNYVLRPSTYIYDETADIVVSFKIKGTASLDRRIYWEGDTTGVNNQPFYGIGSSNTDATKLRVFIRNGAGASLADFTSVSNVFDGIEHEVTYSDVNGVCTLTVDGSPESLGSYTRPTLAAMGINGSSIWAVYRGSASSWFDAKTVNMTFGSRTFDLNEGTGSVIDDDQDTSFTIQGTVLESQWTQEGEVTQYTINAASSGNGDAFVNGQTSVVVDEGTALTFTTNPDTGYVFDQWTPPVPATAQANGTYTASFVVSSETLFYPETYGAARDGVTDDRNAIQAAIDAANANGEGTVVLSPGTYKVGSVMFLRSNVKVEGLGDTSIIKPELTDRTFWFANGASNCEFKDFKVASTFSNDALDFYGVFGVDKNGNHSNLTFDGLTVDCPNMERNAIYFKADASNTFNGITIQNCDFVNSGRMAIEIFSGADTIDYYTNVTITNNRIGNTGVSHPSESIAVSVVGCEEGTVVSDNVFYGSVPFTMIEVAQFCNNCTISGNEFQTSTRRFIYATPSPIGDGPDGLIVENNFTSNGARGGFTLYNVADAIVRNNQLDLDFIQMYKDANNVQWFGNTITFNNESADNADNAAWYMDNCNNANIFSNNITIQDTAFDYVWRLKNGASNNTISSNSVSPLNATIYSDVSGGSGNSYTP